MSRTYNTPPSVLRTKMGEWGRTLDDETKKLLLQPWTALRMGFESVLRIGRTGYSMLDERPQQFFGVGSITQDLLDKAESNRRGGLPPDPFETLAAGPAVLDRGRPVPKPTVEEFDAVRHGQH